MTVYVDNMRARFRRMKMCHMIADTETELHQMAQRIGVARKWYQGDHYDICLSKRALAIEYGAKAITWRQAGCMTIAKRRLGKYPNPDDAVALVRILGEINQAAKRIAALEMAMRTARI